MTAIPAAILLALATIGNPSEARTWSARQDSSLALATFDTVWARINSTYYDSTFRGIDWQAVRHELRPQAAAAGSPEELRGVLRAMVARLGESHFVIIPGEASAILNPGGTTDARGDVGVELRLREDRVLVFRVDSAGPAWANGVRAGWELTMIDDAHIEDVVRRTRAILGSAAHGSKIAAIQIPRAFETRLGGVPGSTVRAVFADVAGQEQAVTLTRRPTRGRAVTFGFLPTVIASVEHALVERGEACVGVVRFNTWMAPIAAELDSAIQASARCRGVVLDLRGNTGGSAGMVMGVAGHFLQRRDSLATMRFRANTLYLVANPRYSSDPAAGSGTQHGRLGIIIDDQSASTTEVFAAAMQHLGRARVFGSGSPGLALPATVTRLPNDDLLMAVVADLTLGDGTRVEGRGVIPDVEVASSRSELAEGRDAALEKAVDWVFSSN